MQQEINQQNIHKMRSIGPLVNIVWSLWIIFDWFLVDPQTLNYCFAIRFLLPIVFIPFYLFGKKILVSSLHVLYTINFTVAFTSLFPLFFATDHFIIYFICAFLVPLLCQSIITFPTKYLFTPLFCFAVFTLFSWDHIISLHQQDTIFYFFYSSTMFAITIFSGYFYRRNRIIRFHLEKQVQASLEEKSSLVRILTHDISNVLMVLGMNFSVIKLHNSKEKLSVQMKRCLDIVEKSTESLGEIVNKVKEMESLDGGKKELFLESTNIASLLNITCDFHLDQYKKKNVDLIFNMNNLENVTVMADSTVLRYNVISNILTNALKFSLPNSSVIVDLVQDEQDLIIRVKDEGIGMPFNLQHSIFDSGKKTTRKGTSGETGTGFGMPLAFACTQKMKGSLSFKSIEKETSPEQHGTTFYIRLPLAKKSSADIAA